jgi:shikimate dehydrogenase
MINSTTELYCIFGNPVLHSRSPEIHNAWFAANSMNAVYLAFEIKDIEHGVQAMKHLGIKGASVTIPFKESIMEFLDHIDDDALKIGAVNTIVNHNGKLEGFNTDCNAGVNPLKSTGIKNKKVCVIGAGGAAHAIAHGIHAQGGKLVIVNRSTKRGVKLARKYNADFIAMDDMGALSGIFPEILINATSVGMTPDIECCPFPPEFIRPGMIVMDIVYTPENTMLLTHARKKGCMTIDGTAMFIHQAAEQFRLWTGMLPDMESVKNIMTRRK